jgi:hypothetical protein
MRPVSLARCRSRWCTRDWFVFSQRDEDSDEQTPPSSLPERERERGPIGKNMRNTKTKHRSEILMLRVMRMSCGGEVVGVTKNARVKRT